MASGAQNNTCPYQAKANEYTLSHLPEKDREAINSYWLSLSDYGIDAVIIDDENVDSPIPQIRTDFHEGLTVADYRKAAFLLGGEDKSFGVVSPSEEDTARVLRAFGDDRTKAASWLMETGGTRQTRAIRLDRERNVREIEAAQMFGYLGALDPADMTETKRENIFSELPSDYAHQ